MDDASAKPDGSESPATADPAGSSLGLVGAFFVIVVIYLLSTGPAAWIEMKFPSTTPTIEAIYRPISLLGENCHPFEVALLWYLAKIWQVPIPLKI